MNMAKWEETLALLCLCKDTSLHRHDDSMWTYPTSLQNIEYILYSLQNIKYIENIKYSSMFPIRIHMWFFFVLPSDTEPWTWMSNYLCKEVKEGRQARRKEGSKKREEGKEDQEPQPVRKVFTWELSQCPGPLSSSREINSQLRDLIL